MANNDVNKNLIERQKELNCLFEINELFSNLTMPIGEIMKEVCVSIEKSMQYNTISRCEIIINGEIYTNKPISKTELKLSAKANQDGNYVEINVYYIKPIRKEHKTIFLTEEQLLLNTIAKKTVHYITYRLLRESYEKLNNGNNTVNLEQNEQVLLWLKNLYLSDDEIKEILKNIIYFKKNETVCKQSTIANYIMLLYDGYMKLSLEHYYEHQFIFKILKPFDFIGLSSLYEVNHYPFTAVTITSSKVYLIEKEVFKKIIFQNPYFAEKILGMYTHNFYFLLNRLNSISNKQALGKLCDVLLYLSDVVFKSSVIESFISRKDIAELCGLSTENTVRMLSDLKNNQIIAINRNEIHILNKAKLVSLSHHG